MKILYRFYLIRKNLLNEIMTMKRLLLVLVVSLFIMGCNNSKRDMSFEKNALIQIISIV